MGGDDEVPPFQSVTLLCQVCQKHYSVTRHFSNFIIVATRLS